MKAVQITAIHEDLEERSLPVPVPADGEVLVAVRAAGICHSDAHYRSGVGSLGTLPITPGHEVAGVIESVGAGVSEEFLGQRVCLHYLKTCGECDYCRRDAGQFCRRAKMIGKDVDGGYAQYIAVPAANAVPLPDDIAFPAAAVMMCSFSTALHAIRRARFAEGESVAIFGVGGLGSAAVRLATAMGASKIIAVDTNRARLRAAEAAGAIGVDASAASVVDVIWEATDDRGVDVALDLVGIPATSGQAIRSLGVQGRAAMVGLTRESVALNMYSDVIGKEREIVGVSDHLPTELHELIGLARSGCLNVDSIVSETIPLDAAAVNKVFARLDGYSGEAIRTVIEIS